MKKIFIDGSAGTTGLRIFERLKERKDISIISLDEQVRKDVSARKQAINQSDVTFLCLPDDSARESVSLVENPNTVIIDASTAHRTQEGWTYGFPEISASIEEKLSTSKRIAVPGCHASGVVALITPLIEKGILNKDSLISCTSITGYSGGGKKMISEYETNKDNRLLDFPRQYAITQQHKHLKEIAYYTKLNTIPAFSPIVAPFYSGMEVSIPIFAQQLNKGYIRADVVNALKEQYNSKIVYYDDSAEEGFLSAGICSGKDCMQIAVFGNDDRILLTARYDNLGKGASGAAIECLNYVLGLSPETGLEL